MMLTSSASPARNLLCPLTKFTWGLDLSDQNGNAPPWQGGVSESPAGLHGAGGIGGLLAMLDTKNNQEAWDDVQHIFFYDANGNVGQVMDARAGSAYYGQAVARYEYYPFGGVLVARTLAGSSGPKNPFLFSTKYRDAETSLYYWHYRYLIPRLGRWTSRDPAGEDLSVLLYAFVGNSPTLRYDALGLWGDDLHGTRTEEIAKLAGLSDDCAERIAKGNLGVDERTGSAFYPQYHFDRDSFGRPFKCGGRSYWQQEWERQAREILGKMCEGGCCEGLGGALELLGKSLHALQDGFAHCEKHYARSPIDHAPWLCLVPPFIFSPECWKKGHNPNWVDPHKPDRTESWPEDAARAEKATIDLVEDLMARFPCLAACCTKEQGKSGEKR